MEADEIRSKLAPIAIMSNPTPIIAPLAPSQDTTPDQVSAFYRPVPIPFVRHSPLPVAASGSAGAASKTISQTLAQKQVFGSIRNVNQIPQSQLNQGVSTPTNSNTDQLNQVQSLLPSTYTLTGSWTNPSNAIDRDPNAQTFATASSTTSNVVYLATIFPSYTTQFTSDFLQVIMQVTAVTGGAVLIEYSVDGTNWNLLRSTTTTDSVPVLSGTFLPSNTLTQNVQVRVTLPGSASGSTANVTDYAGTGADDASIGTHAWSNPGNAVGNQTSVFAISAFAGTVVTHYLKLTNFGFSIPVGATINGIQAAITRYGNTFSNYNPRTGVYTAAIIYDNDISLYKAGAITGSSLATGTSWVGTATVNYGGSTNLWGAAWGPADINNAGFGIGISANLVQSGTGLPGAKVYSVGITIFYTTAAGSSSATVNLYDIEQLVVP